MREYYTKSSPYSVVYSDMAGVDFTGGGEKISKRRFAYLENMYRDYDGDDYRIVESIPGFRRIATLGKKIHALYSYQTSDGDDIAVIHAEDGMYSLNVTKNEGNMPTRIASSSSDKSCAVRFNSALYLFSGSMFCFENGGVHTVDTISDMHPYVPTTYQNGVEYERLNLLCDKFRESYIIGSTKEYSYGSDGLKYRVLPNDEHSCAVVGFDGTDTKIFIPNRVRLGSEYFSVKTIDNGAFKENASITELFIAEGVTEIGALAFYKCSSLARVKTPSTITKIGAGAFSDCAKLVSIYLGEALREIGNAAFSMTNMLTTVHYGLDEAAFEEIIGKNALGEFENIVYNSKVENISLALPLNTPTIGISSVSVGGEKVNFQRVNDNGRAAVKIDFMKRENAEGKEIIIDATASQNPEDYKTYGGFYASAASGRGYDIGAIYDAGCATVFDGRIFLSGIPEANGLVFFSGRDKNGNIDPTYFPDCNYFIDADGSASVCSMCPVAGRLAVFISGRGTDGGSVYYHEPKETGIDTIPKIYPVTGFHTGLGQLGASVSFFDDPVFVSRNGICALEKSNINLERSVVVRSHNVNPRLLLEDISKISLAVWRGYLVVLCGERIYLADSRDIFKHPTGGYEYEWYFLNGIGAYENDSRIYRYSATDTLPPGISQDGVCLGEVFSEMTDDGSICYYTVEGDEKISVYPTEQMSGGNFYAASHMTVIGDRLIFATEGSHLCIFNNDKRGVAPDSISSEKGFDKNEFSEAYGRKIHPLFYSFAGHAPRCALQTAMDDCSMPNLLKNTEKRSLTVKCRAMSQARVICEVGTDKSGYTEAATFPSGSLSFGDLDFSTLTLSADDSYTVLLTEKEKGWLEKQIAIHCEDFASPFGIYSIAYRYRIKGRMRRRNNF